MDDSLISIFIVFVILFAGAIVIFLIIRSIVLWYWKIDKSIALQKAQLLMLIKIAEQSGVKDDDIYKALRYSRGIGDIDDIQIPKNTNKSALTRNS